MSKIVIDARQYSTSTGRYTSRLIQYLEQLDSQNEYIVLLKPSDVDSWQPTTGNFSKQVCPYKEYTFAEQLQLKRQLEALQPDLVHFGMVQQPILYRGAVVTTIHDLTTARFTNPDKQPLVFKAKQLVYKEVIKRAAHKSAQLIVPSEFVKDDVVSYAHIDPAKVTVTYEAADRITEDPVAFDSLAGKQFIMYVGRPTPHKNLERLIAAFQQLQAQQPDLRLVLAGKLDSNYRTIRQNVETKQIANILFTDFIDEGQLRWLYEHCAAYVFPSLSEGFGLPPLEAMIHGAPVVSSNATCLPEISGDAAHYFDPLDVANMAMAINEVLTDKSLRATLIAAGSTQVQKYSWRRMAEQTLVIYQKALNR